MSLRINREMNLATADRETVRDLMERLFWVDFQMSQEITEAIPVDLRHAFAETIADTFL
jgi:hypothetical protein